MLLLTTVLPVLFKYCYKYCYSDSRKIWAVMKGGGLALLNLIQPTISLEMPVPSQGHYGFRSLSVVDWFCLFIYLCILTFPLYDCSEFGNFFITLIYYIVDIIAVGCRMLRYPYLSLNIKVRGLLKNVEVPTLRKPHSLLLYKCYKFNGITYIFSQDMNDIMNLQATTLK